jgi:vitamin-K-epoxide reductase (warfarin-sensitive)
VRAAVNPRSQWLMVLIAVLAVCGIVVSSVSLQHHYAKSKTDYCEVGQNFNCDIVNRSEYSQILGIFPVAGIGILGYAALLGLATVYRKRRETPRWIFLAALAGLVFALRLTYIEARVLYTWCILCLSSLALIAAITLLASVVWVQSHSRNS